MQRRVDHFDFAIKADWHGRRRDLQKQFPSRNALEVLSLSYLPLQHAKAEAHQTNRADRFWHIDGEFTRLDAVAAAEMKIVEFLWIVADEDEAAAEEAFARISR